MKNIFILLSVFILLISCSSWDNCDPESVQSNWETGKEIIVSYDTLIQRNLYEITQGNKILFIYDHTGAQCDHVYDDEWGEILSFVIKEDLTEFEFKDAAITGSSCHYQQYGAWVGNDKSQVKKGTITGKKSGKSWEISVSVETNVMYPIEQTKTIEFTAQFDEK